MDKRTHSVHPRYSAGSPGWVDRDIAMDVMYWEKSCYEHALEGIYGEEQKARAMKLGLSGIVEYQKARAHHIEFYDEMTSERGIRKNGQRILNKY